MEAQPSFHAQSKNRIVGGCISREVYIASCIGVIGVIGWSWKMLGRVHSAAVGNFRPNVGTCKMVVKSCRVYVEGPEFLLSLYALVFTWTMHKPFV